MSPVVCITYQKQNGILQASEPEMNSTKETLPSISRNNSPAEWNAGKTQGKRSRTVQRFVEMLYSEQQTAIPTAGHAVGRRDSSSGSLQVMSLAEAVNEFSGKWVTASENRVHLPSHCTRHQPNSNAGPSQSQPTGNRRWEWHAHRHNTFSVSM